MGKLKITQENINLLSTVEWLTYAIYDLAEKDDRVIALTADLGTSNKFVQMSEFTPRRYFNVGIAEQNLVGVSSGMALSGLIPFVAAFSGILTKRALEQIYLDICYQNLNVKLIGTHAGLSFSTAGCTHFSNEDIAIMRTIPNLIVLSPADGPEISKAVTEAYKHNGPVYMRINRGIDKIVNTDINYSYKIGKAITLKEGNDLTIISTGRTVYNSLEAAKIVKNKTGASVRVINMHTIKPIDVEAISNASEETGKILTVEDHTILGGLGTVVSEVIAENRLVCSLKRIGIKDTFAPIGSTHDDIMEILGYGINGITEEVIKLL